MALATPSSRLSATRRARSMKRSAAAGGQSSRAVSSNSASHRSKWRASTGQGHMLRHRLAVIAPRLKRQRRPEREHVFEMRLPVRDARFEDRREQRILPHAGIEAANQRLDHRLVDAGLLLRQRDDGGAPLLGAAKLMVHSGLHNSVLIRPRASLEVVSQDARVIVRVVVRGVEQGHRAGLHEVLQAVDRVLVGAELSPVASGEFGEARRVMAEPSP